ERYSRGFELSKEMTPAWLISSAAGQHGPWADGQGGEFYLPFVYSSNGRPQVKQLPELSGTWFRDARLASNTARSLPSF
ncbi:hypothetical protein ACVBEH_31685, partial [Roseateles sp. GG27B]